MLRKVLSVLTGSSKSSLSSDPRRRPPLIESQAVVPSRHGNVQEPGVAESSVLQLTQSNNFGYIWPSQSVWLGLVSTATAVAAIAPAC